MKDYLKKQKEELRCFFENKKTVEGEFGHPRVGLGLCIRRNGKVLLRKRKGTHASGFWAFPGGHLEKYETFQDCALREMREESGDLTVTDPKFWTVVNAFFGDEDKHYVVILMVCDWISGEASVMEPEKCECWGWFDWNDLPDPLMPGIQYVKQTDENPFESK